ncbi:unnamed protein product [Gongylonema pulchrum]|uniref:Protein LTV1 homolog n=1 Tax=Gongylonema pulchrum TaxID=637853 RepID=A0A183ESQ5_9BILA|nr:unnamed protein product [Gongylonema pulchrum]
MALLWVGTKDEVALRYAEIDEDAEEVEEELKQITIDVPGKKKAKWDCETIVSTYSNLYNRPALIVDSSRKRKLKPVLKEIEVR